MVNGVSVVRETDGFVTNVTMNGAIHFGPITNSLLTAGKLMSLDSLKRVTNILASDVEGNFLVGVTSGIQGQLNDKLSSLGDSGSNMTFTGLTTISSLAAGNALIYDTAFPGTALPPDWIETGGWTANNGLVPPGTGGWNVSSVWNKRTGQDRSTIVSRVTVTDTNAVFGLVRKDIILPNLVGTIGLVDGVNNFIRIMGHWDSATIPHNSNSVAMATMTAGRDYILTLSKTDAGHVTFSITDTVTGVATTVSTAAHSYGEGYSGPGAISLSGVVKYKNMRMYANAPRNPRVAIFGDSYIEGDSIGNIDATNYFNRWAYKALTNLNGNCMIAGIGGESSIGYQLRMAQDLVPFKPQYAIFALGYNDTTFSTWKANIELMATQCRAIGTIPVFVTFPPRTSNQAFLTQANNWLTITNNSYRYIDIGAALTVGGDRLTWVSAYLLSDNIHPTIAGHVAIYNQACLDLFNELTDSYSDTIVPPDIVTIPSYFLTPFGLGTSTPRYALDVVANTSQVWIESTNSAIATFARNVAGSYLGMSINGDNTGPYFLTVGTGHKFRWFPEGIQTLTLSTNGIGVGVTSPASRLDVSGYDGQVTMNLFSTNANGINVFSTNGIGVNIYSSVGTGLRIQSDNAQITQMFRTIGTNNYGENLKADNGGAYRDAAGMAFDRHRWFNGGFETARFSTNQVLLSQPSEIQWASSFMSSVDTGLLRASAGVLQVTDAAGGYGEISSKYLASGTGSPETVLAKPVGAIYRRTDGGAGTTIYIKESGTGNTGWIAYSGNSGTVTSVAASVPSFLSIAGSPVTTSGTLAITLGTQSTNKFLAGPISNNSAAAPTFRTLDVTDFASGSGATSSTFWRGDGTWANPATGDVSDTAYAGSWDGTTTIAPSKNAVYDILQTLAPLAAPTFTGVVTLPGIVDTAGSLAWATGSGAITQIKGPTDQALAIAAQPPAQVSASVAGNALTLTASAATAGSASGGAAGGAVTITAGAGNGFSGAAGAGGAITISAGAASGSQVGGAINITAGTSQSGGGNAGIVTITGGTASGGGGIPGNIVLNAGAQAAAGGTVAVGGAILAIATAGRALTTDSATGGVGGVNTFTTGAGGAESSNVNGTGGAGGLFSVVGGPGGAATGAGGTHLGGNGAGVTLTTGAGGAATGASGTRTGGNSGALTLATGAAGTGASANGTAGPIVFKVGGTQYAGIDATGHFTVGTTGAAIVSILSATATLDFPSTLAAASSDLTITVTGAAVNDSVSLGLPAAPSGSVAFNAFVSSADTVTVRAFNVGTIAADPASAVYRVTVHHF